MISGKTFLLRQLHLVSRTQSRLDLNTLCYFLAGLAAKGEGDLFRSKLKSPSFRSSLSGKALNETYPSPLREFRSKPKKEFSSVRYEIERYGFVPAVRALSHSFSQAVSKRLVERLWVSELSRQAKGRRKKVSESPISSFEKNGHSNLSFINCSWPFLNQVVSL